MSTNKYVPSDEDMREAWRAFTGPNRDHGFDAFLARVRRDAAREALDGYAGSLDILTAPFRHLEGDRVRHWRDTHYPEESP